MSDKKAVNLEKSLGELEKLVEKLEGGEATLDESLVLFEKGVSLFSRYNVLADCHCCWLRDGDKDCPTARTVYPDLGVGDNGR